MKNTKSMHPRVFNTLHSAGQEELESIYKDWADQYEQDVIDLIGYIGHTIATELLLKYLGDSQARILDAGCGTGLVGEALSRKGFSNVLGVDFSQAMLDQAGEKGVYQSLELADLTKDFVCNDNSFDAIVCAGTFTCGHVGPGALNEMVRITKAGGYISFTVREQEWDEAPYADVIASLKDQGRWQCVEQCYTGYNLKEGANCQLCLYRVC
ncbi:MAG: class I SAM-dependent methyltransferase [Gammaproteobacteria bacterium]|nr:class I SAM-dependent methyltransferase [Gammaproteobacteria bacterium]